ncbi:MAG: DUF4292 domain-containing protein [Muribaculaceae bacterium]|nr:DUF4292 domain-containing protein [Muribaculaceae bacterium]
MRTIVKPHLLLAIRFLPLLLLFFVIPISAQEPLDSLPASGSEELNDGFIDTKEEAKGISIQGKLKMAGLPLSPSLKIYLEKDSLIDISVRAPLIGEAGRLEITPDSVTIVNKMNKTYVKEGIADFLRYYPGGINDVQSLLLARFFLPGVNIEEANLEELIDIYYENEQYNVIPKGEAELPGITYGYIVDQYFNPLTLVILPESRPDVEIDTFYTYSIPPSSPFTYPTSPYTIQLIYQEGAKALEINLELKQPELTDSAPKPIDVSKKYRQVSISDFLRSF